MGLEMLKRLGEHLALATIGQLFARPGEWNPKRAADLLAHRGGQVVDFSGNVAHQIKTHDLEDALAVSPRANVKILTVEELGNDLGGDSGLLEDLAHGGGLGFFAGIDESLGETEHGGALASGSSRRFLLWLGCGRRGVLLF
jgi:hypothetical protein